MCGIGFNMLMFKLSMDIEVKKNCNNIVKWNYDDIKNYLWLVILLFKMWGIGYRMELYLNKFGLFIIGDIVNYFKEKLKCRFGVLGEELWYYMYGIDLSEIKDKYKFRIKFKFFGLG